MNKSTMHHIMFTILLFTTQRSLFSMELITPSNSSSEMYFLINNITPQYPVPKDIKEKLLTLYIAMTDDERKQADRYTFIESSDYMNLNKENKLYITNFWCSNMTKIEEQTIIFHSHDAPQDYAQMLKLPQHIRRQIAKQYSSTAFVKTKDKNVIFYKADVLSCIKDEAGARAGIDASIIIGTTAIIEYCLLPTYPIATIISIIPALIVADQKSKSHIKDHFIKNALDWYPYQGYKLLSLLPENDNK